MMMGSNGLMAHVPFTLLKILMHLFWMGPLEKLTGVLNGHFKAKLTPDLNNK